MNRIVTIRISGEAGQGIQSVGQGLCSLYKQRGLYFFAHQDYMSRVRGGNNFFQLSVAVQPVYAPRSRADILVALDKDSSMLHKEAVSESGIMIVDRKKYALSGESARWYDLPLYETALRIGGSDLFISSVAFGAVGSMNGIDFASIEENVRLAFQDKTEDVIAKNIACARAGYDFVERRPASKTFRLQSGMVQKSLLINGNEAIALGAIKAGCKFYAAYPMTPSTSIMNTVAHYAKRFNIVVDQAEDEIAAINMVIGASSMGVRAMTGTSGGGFALMGEGISLAGMTETPVVIVDAQRPAPATGLPTRTEQADLNFLLHSGHGEFARVLYSPGSIEEAFYLTVRAFNVAEKYQIPALIMTDQYLADSYRPVPVFDMQLANVQRSLITKQESATIQQYKRYALTTSGVSPRAVPGWISDVIYVDSDEHTEEGHITEDAGVRVAMVEKRLCKKMSALRAEIVPPTSINLKDAKKVLVGFGSTLGVMREAAQELEEHKVGCVHFSQIWPFPAEAFAQLIGSGREVITVENNAGAQLAGLIRRETDVRPARSILRYDGRPFDVESLLAQV